MKLLSKRHSGPTTNGLLRFEIFRQIALTPSTAFTILAFPPTRERASLRARQRRTKIWGNRRHNPVILHSIQGISVRPISRLWRPPKFLQAPIREFPSLPSTLPFGELMLEWHSAWCGMHNGVMILGYGGSPTRACIGRRGGNNQSKVHCEGRLGMISWYTSAFPFPRSVVQLSVCRVCCQQTTADV